MKVHENEGEKRVIDVLQHIHYFLILIFNPKPQLLKSAKTFSMYQNKTGVFFQVKFRDKDRKIKAEITLP